MRNVIISLCFFVFPLFFPLCTCQVHGQRTPATQSGYVQDADFRFLENEYPPEDLPQTLPETANTDIWDVSTVDVSQIDNTRKLVSFTFDDTPARNLENILAVFAAFNESNPSCKATATLFVNGHLTTPEAKPFLSAAFAMNFELGNHTHSHLDLTTLTESEMQNEIDRTDEILQKIDGKRRHLLRAPFGKTNQALQAQAQTPIINWTIDTLDWTGVSAEEIYDSVSVNLYPGAIILMHDGYQNTVDALKKLLPDLEKRGYQVVNVSQLAKAHNCTLRKGKVYVRARKQ